MAQTSTNQSQSATLTTTSTITDNTTKTGDLLAGTYTIAPAGSLQITRATSAGVTTNSSLTVSTTGSSYAETRLQGGGQTKGGDYSTTVTSASTATNVETTFNQSLTATATTTTTAHETGTRTGNVISGAYTTTANAASTSTATQTSADQTQKVTATTFARDASSTSETGQDIPRHRYNHHVGQLDLHGAGDDHRSVADGFRHEYRDELPIQHQHCRVDQRQFHHDNHSPRDQHGDAGLHQSEPIRHRHQLRQIQPDNH